MGGDSEGEGEGGGGGEGGAGGLPEPLGEGEEGGGGGPPGGGGGLAGLAPEPGGMAGAELRSRRGLLPPSGRLAGLAGWVPQGTGLRGQRGGLVALSRWELRASTLWHFARPEVPGGRGGGASRQKQGRQPRQAAHLYLMPITPRPGSASCGRWQGAV